MDPEISVVIPVYNAEGYINKCIKSINAQSFTNYEVILVDDGSTDNAVELIEKEIKGKSNWQLLQQKNAGPSAARNNGIANAKGTYLAFIDADDYVEPQYLEYLYHAIKFDASDLACCGYYDHSANGLLALNSYDTGNKQLISVMDFIPLVFKYIGGVLWDKLFKTAIIRDNHLKLCEDIYMSEDLLFVLDYLMYTKTISVIKTHLYHYNRMPGQSISQNVSIRYKQNLINVNQQIKSKLEHLNIAHDAIELIIGKNIFNYVQTMVIQINQHKGTEAKRAVLNDLYHDEYLKKNYKEFPVSLFYKPYLSFVRQQKITPVILYSYFLKLLKSLR